MESILVSWIGQRDLDALGASKGESHGPVYSTLEHRAYSEVFFLYNYPEDLVRPYLDWLAGQVDIRLSDKYIPLKSPIAYNEIYEAADALLADVVSKCSGKKIEILISPGTPAMQSVWILLGKTKYYDDAIFIQATREQGVQVADIPFDIVAEFTPRIQRSFFSLAAAEVAVGAGFEDILTKDPVMNNLKAQASVLANYNVPVLIYGETGTGKELFARAIHNASRRKGAEFIAVNCGAFAPDLIDSKLFGHKKGAFTGAISDQDGFFQAAHGGTLFLDEFGELTLEAQVRLLRVLNDGEIQKLGATKAQKVDVRIIAATNRDLLKLVSEGKFREDLFFRVAVGVLKLPPLRDRTGDIKYLAERLLDKVNRDCHFDKPKSLSAGSIRAVQRHGWRGNVRELYSTLLRASLSTKELKLSEKDIENAFFEIPVNTGSVLDRDVSQGVNILEIIGEVAEHYINRAWDAANGKKTKAAELLGFENYQRLDSWMKKYGIEKNK